MNSLLQHPTLIPYSLVILVFCSYTHTHTILLFSTTFGFSVKSWHLHVWDAYSERLACFLIGQGPYPTKKTVHQWDGREKGNCQDYQRTRKRCWGWFWWVLSWVKSIWRELTLERVILNLSLGLFLRIPECHSTIVFGQIGFENRQIMTADAARGVECQRQWRYCNTVQYVLITFSRRFLIEALSPRERIPTSLKGVLPQHVAFCPLFVYLWLLMHVHLACTPKVPAG